MLRFSTVVIPVLIEGFGNKSPKIRKKKRKVGKRCSGLGGNSGNCNISDIQEKLKSNAETFKRLKAVMKGEISAMRRRHDDEIDFALKRGRYLDWVFNHHLQPLI
jgi:hypothetical protein